MAKKKIKSDGIYFTGESSNDVTGSQYFIKFGDKNILLECGLHQSSSNSYLDSYKINSEKFKFNPREIDYVFINHPHIDHCGLLPRLIKEGFNGKIITTYKSARVMRALLLNSSYIIQDEARMLSRRFGRIYKPLYEESDVYNTFKLFNIYNEYNTIFELDDKVSFQWFKNSHCVGATQLQLILKDGNRTRKILYTSDIGALNTQNSYVENTIIPQGFNDVTLMESTYGNNRASKKSRKFDIEHLKVAVDTVTERQGSIIMPCFSFSRTQELLTTLYDIFSNDENFKIPIYVDSKLSCEICELYSNILLDDDKEKWNTVREWKNVNFITEKEDSQACIVSNTPKIIISSSGFCTNGRIVNYLKRYLRDRNSMIIFSGYAGDNDSYLSYRIKNYRERRTLSINKERIPNRADCISLTTFSSHADFNDLIEYGSSLDTNKLVLVHGSKESKANLAKHLSEAISKKNKSFRVITSVKDMVIHI